MQDWRAKGSLIAAAMLVVAIVAGVAGQLAVMFFAIFMALCFGASVLMREAFKIYRETRGPDQS